MLTTQWAPVLSLVRELAPKAATVTSHMLQQRLKILHAATDPAQPSKQIFKKKKKKKIC